MNKFDLNQNKWISKSKVSKVKSLFDNSNVPLYGNDFSTHRYKRSFFLFDYEKAIVEEYSSDSGLLANLVSFQILGDHIYTLNRFDETYKVYKTPLKLFFSQKLSLESVVNQKVYYLPFAILIIIFLLVFIFIYFRKKHNDAVSIITNRLYELEFDISKVQYDLLKEIVEKHPKPIPFKFVLSLYDDSIGYEAKKLKTRKTVKELNDQLEKKFGLKQPLEVRRNP